MPVVPSVRDIDVETLAAIAGILARMTLGLAEAGWSADCCPIDGVQPAAAHRQFPGGVYPAAAHGGSDGSALS